MNQGLAVFFELNRMGIFEFTDVASKLYHRDLQPETDAEERHVILSCELNGRNLAFSTSIAKSTGH